MALAVTGRERHPDLPDVATYEEQGYDIQTGINVGLVAPAGTPQEIVDKLEEAMRQISEDRTYVRLLDSLGDKPAFLDSQAYRENLQRYADSSKQVADILREAGVIE